MTDLLHCREMAEFASSKILYHPSVTFAIHYHHRQELSISRRNRPTYRAIFLNEERMGDAMQVDTQQHNGPIGLDGGNKQTLRV
jgi:hypothetical protein